MCWREVMSKNILENFYYKTVGVYPIKGIIHKHLRYDYDKLNRKFYRINDLELWFKSNFEEGEELYLKRVSEKAKYDF